MIHFWYVTESFGLRPSITE
uniref:Uncharacterized protein n=1 Tax=Anguilla anguilla TaxID=7936 RepID=A0A0E9UN54_ANGAN